MSSPSESQQDNELYEFDSDYLDELNRIRRGFHLEEISSDEPHQNEPQENIPLSDAEPIPVCSRSELYEFDTSYINDLNAIRKRFHLSAIRLESQTIVQEPEEAHVESVNVNIQVETESTTSSSTEEVDDETITSYRERGKSSENLTEETSTVTSTSHGLQSPFSIPDEEPVEPVTPTVTILNTAVVYHHKQHTIARNQVQPLDLSDGTSCSEVGSVRTALSSVRDPTIRTSLDVPHQFTEQYEFPNIVNVSKWVQNLTKDVELDRICTEKPPEKPKGVCTKKLIFEDQKNANEYRQKAEEMLSEKVPSEIDTALSMSNMDRCKQTVDMEFYDVEGQTTKSEQADSDDAAESSSKCACFRMCFVKKRKKYFS